MTEPTLPSSRLTFEEHQRQWLCSYAVTESFNGGRRFAEDEHGYRTAFQRDRDRIMHCSAFRRLDYKTQVFVPHEVDHFRTRLTHTLEVAQVGRTIGRALRLNEDLIEAVALAHDLGHPPFGHGGESVLDELMSAHGHFEHNRQSLRVVDYLEHPYPQFRGLNLTSVTRECIAKHETRYDSPVCSEFDRATHPVLEGQIVDLSDEIAYTSADLEDSLACKEIRIDQLADLAMWQMAWGRTCEQMPDARDIHKTIRASKMVLEIMAGDLLSTTRARIDQFACRSVDDVRSCAEKLAGFSEPMSLHIVELQDFLLENVYTTGDSAANDKQGRRVIQELFEAYLGDSSLLPARYLRRVEDEGLHRVICDYIAGMTDRFCKKEHTRIVG